MIEIIKELDIEVSKPNLFQAVVAKQYDMNTRFIKATFVDSGNKIYIDPDATVKVVINALRQDGQSKGFEGEVNQDGTVTVPLHSWMLELAGAVSCDISVIDTETDDNKKLTTTGFTLLVEQAAFGGDDITSDPQFDVLVALLEAGEVAQEALDKSNEANAKYDACVEATEAANQAKDTLVLTHEDIVSGGYIEALKELNDGGKFSFWVGSREQYDAISEKVTNCLYLITDEVTGEDINAVIGELQERLGEAEVDIAYHSNVLEQHEISINEHSVALAEHRNNISQNTSDIANLQNRDFIVDQGEFVAGAYTWHYRKWDSGYLECWLHGSATMSVLNSCGGGEMYRTDYIRHELPAGMFTELIYANVSVIVWDTVGLPHTQIVQASAEHEQIQWFLYRLSSTENSQFDFAVEINGKWK